MASVGGVDFETEEPGVVGGAFFLTTSDDIGCSTWAAEPIAAVPVDGQRVRVVGDRAAFVWLLTGSFGGDEIVEGSLEIAQRALDLEVAHGEAPLALRRADEQHIVWWRDGDQVVLRVVVSRPPLASTRATAGPVQRYL